MQDHTRQRDFICAHVEQIKKHRNKTVSSRRQNTYHYFFTVNGSRIKVCKAVFLATLNIGEKNCCVHSEKGKTETGQAKRDMRVDTLQAAKNLKQ